MQYKHKNGLLAENRHGDLLELPFGMNRAFWLQTTLLASGFLTFRLCWALKSAQPLPPTKREKMYKTHITLF